MSRAGACRYLSRRHAIVPVHVAAACRRFGLFSGVFLCRSQEPGLDDARVLLPGDPLDASIPQKSKRRFADAQTPLLFCPVRRTGRGIDARIARQGETRIEAQFRASNKERKIP